MKATAVLAISMCGALPLLGCDSRRPNEMTNSDAFEAESYRDCLEQAKLGDHAAQARLSLRLFCGDGVPVDIGEAYEWLEKAAEDAGTARACFERGCERGEAGALYGMYLLLDMAADPDHKKDWSHYLVAAAEQDYVQAQCLLGINHLYNAEQYGFEDSPEKAEYWLLKAVDNGSTQPYSHLYHLYNEYLQPADPQRAFQYILEAAADEGLPSDMYYLAEAYEQGRGVEKDLVEAAKWWYLRAVQYSDASCEDLDRVCCQLTKAELDDAASRAKDWIVNDAKKAKCFEMVAEPLDWPAHKP